MVKIAWILLAGLSLLSGTVLADPMSTDPTPSLTIVSEARCVESAGIPIQEVPDNQVKLACLRDKSVQMQCNPDGRHARLQAFRQWQSQLIDFKERCVSVGGVFSFASLDFVEPSNESYCSQAQPEVAYNAFETPLCNFVSRCPPAAVTCARSEEAFQSAQRVVALPGVPKPISIAP